MDIQKDLQVFNKHSLPDNFVAVLAFIKNKNAYHAGILIRYDKKDYLHHYTGSNTELIEGFDIDGICAYKILNFIGGNKSEVEPILWWCKKICEKSNITYSFLFDDSSYDEQGEFISKSGLPEFGTCVGFCVNTLNSIILDLNSSYLALDDWDMYSINHPYNDRFDKAAREKYPEINWELYNAFKKRITPLEYICSGFFSFHPIRKSQIVEIEKAVQEDIITKFN